MKLSFCEPVSFRGLREQLLNTIWESQIRGHDLAEIYKYFRVPPLSGVVVE